MCFYYLFSAMTTFSNFQATFALISPIQYLEYSHQISAQKSEIYKQIIPKTIQMLVKFQRNRHVCPGFLFIKTACIIIIIKKKPSILRNRSMQYRRSLTSGLPSWLINRVYFMIVGKACKIL